MGSILSEAQSQRIRQLNKDFNRYAKRGWMCEGSDKFGPCNCIFNNDTDEVFWADYNGNILDMEYVTNEPIMNCKAMAVIQGKIRKV